MINLYVHTTVLIPGRVGIAYNSSDYCYQENSICMNGSFLWGIEQKQLRLLLKGVLTFGITPYTVKHGNSENFTAKVQSESETTIKGKERRKFDEPTFKY